MAFVNEYISKEDEKSLLPRLIFFAKLRASLPRPITGRGMPNAGSGLHDSVCSGQAWAAATTRSGCSMTMAATMEVLIKS